MRRPARDYCRPKPKEDL